jgi:hypothetical protein
MPNSLITSNGHFQPWYAISTINGTITIERIPNCVNLNDKNKKNTIKNPDAKEAL